MKSRGLQPARRAPLDRRQGRFETAQAEACGSKSAFWRRHISPKALSVPAEAAEAVGTRVPARVRTAPIPAEEEAALVEAPA